MTQEVGLIFVLLAAVLAVFIWGRLRVDLVAILVLLCLAATGLVSSAQAVDGFSSPAVLTVCAIFILSAGLNRSGVAHWIGRHVLRLAGRGDLRMLVVIMLTSGFMSFFMNTIGIVALMLPVVMDIARRTGRAPSKLLMPLTFGALLGGLTTLFATLPNLLASQALRDAGFAPFGMFDFVPIGLAAAFAGIAFMALIGRHLLPNRDLRRETSAQLEVNLRDHYALAEQTFVLRVPTGSVLSKKTLSEARFGSVLGLHVVGVIRGPKTHLAPDPSWALQDGDQLLVQGTPSELENLAAWQQLTLREPDRALAELLPEEVAFAEAQLPPSSAFVGQTLPWIDLRRRYGVNVLAIRRGQAVRRSHLHSWRLHAGDSILLHGMRDQLMALSESPELSGFHLLAREELAASYRLEERLFVLEVPEGSHLAEHSLAESRLGDVLGLTVVAILRHGDWVSFPGPGERIRAGDQLWVAGQSEDLELLQGMRDLTVQREQDADWNQIESSEVGLLETVVPPRSSFVGKTLRQIHFRERFGLTVLGLLRQGEVVSAPLRDVPLQVGDGLLLFGARDKLSLVGQDRNLIVLTETAQEEPRWEKAPVALAALLLFLVPVFFGWVPLPLGALTGAAVMVLFGCLSMEEAYESVDWRAVVLIAGMLPMGTAMQETGAATFLAERAVETTGAWGPRMVIAGLFLVTSLGTLVLPGAALIVLMAPIAIRASTELGISPHAVMMAVAMAASGSFNSPVSHPANVMIMGPAGYRFSDFLKVGVSMTGVVFLVVMLVLPWFWPLRP